MDTHSIKHLQGCPLTSHKLEAISVGIHKAARVWMLPDHYNLQIMTVMFGAAVVWLIFSEESNAEPLPDSSSSSLCLYWCRSSVLRARPASISSTCRLKSAVSTTLSMSWHASRFESVHHTCTNLHVYSQADTAQGCMSACTRRSLVRAAAALLKQQIPGCTCRSV